MKLKTFFPVLGILAMLALQPLELRAVEQPNIVVMLVDDMGVMDTSLPFLTGADGKVRRYPLNEFYRTPNMERLAARGIRFSNFNAMSVCSPTRTSIMTGQTSARHRVTNWINGNSNNRGPQGPDEWNWSGLKKGDVALPRLLQSAGYRTIHVGKAHFGPKGSEGIEPRNIGFDVNVGGSDIGQPGSYYGMKNFGNGPKATHGVPGLEKYHGTDIFLTDALTIEANAHVAKAVEEKKPFFLYFAQYAVHAPFNADPRFAANYAKSGKPAQAQAFATLIEGMDKSLGDVMDHLEKIGVADNTLVIFLGDNGSDAPLGHQHEVACAAPLRGKKGSHYEGGMRVPFIAAWAKADANNANQKQTPIPAGAIQQQLASVNDLFPTILGLAGASAPKGHAVDGSSLATLFSGKADLTHTQDFLMHYPHTHRTDYFTSYRRGDWKVVYHYFPTQVSGGSHYQLFNLAADPFEQDDVAAKQPAKLHELMEGLVGGLEKSKALYPQDKDGKPVKPELPAKG